MADVVLKCFKCDTEMKFVDRVGRREECPNCREDVHVCRNCRFYDPKVYNECREPAAEVARDKERANHCDYFSPGAGGGGGGAKSKTDLLAAAEALFKKKT